jgi:protein-disulfide isomerase
VELPIVRRLAAEQRHTREGPEVPKQPAKNTTVSDGKGSNRQQARERARLEAAKVQRSRRIRQGIVVGVVALVAIGIVATAVVIGTAGRSERVPTASTEVTVGGTSVPFSIDGSAVQVGRDDAKVTLDLWVDNSCPHCQEFEADSNDVIAQRVADGTLKARYHNIQIVTAYGSQAGSAAACVANNAPEQWWAFNAALYANHSTETDSWQGSQLADFASQQGITDEEALGCIRDQRYTSWITDNTAAAGEAGVTGTPTLFFNGQQSETVSGAALGAKIDELASGG